MSFIEPYLDENVVWKGGVPYRVINGKENYLKLMAQVFDSLQYSKKSYRADVVMMNEYYACITIDGEYEDLAHRIKIEDGLIKEIWIKSLGAGRRMRFAGNLHLGFSIRQLYMNKLLLLLRLSSMSKQNLVIKLLYGLLHTN